MTTQIIDTHCVHDDRGKTPKPSCYMSPRHSYYYDCSIAGMATILTDASLPTSG